MSGSTPGLIARAFARGIGLADATGSFRGAPFRLDSYETAIGRRAEIHEYPLRNIPGGEDLGRKARRFSFNAYIVGPLWEFQRDALLNACEQDGPGTLVHPFHGEHTVICEQCTCSESRQGGTYICTFSLSFTEYGTLDTPGTTQDEGYVLLDQSKQGYGVIEGAF